VQQIDLVCLCQLYDLKDMYREAFAKTHPWINLLRPAEVKDPTRIRHAFAFSPGRQDFDPYPNLALVSSMGAGVDALLQHPGLRKDIVVSRLIDPEQGQMMAGFALYYIVGWHREMWRYQDFQAKGIWQPINRSAPSALPVGILGFGNMARSLAAALRQLGYPVTAYASRPGNKDGIDVLAGRDGLLRLAAASRALVNLLPLTPQTEGLLSAEVFAEMPENALLLQLGRGGHLVEEDLLDGLAEGRPAMAALDVFATEPLPPDHPFWTHDRVMITPHVASDAAEEVMANWVAEGIRAFESGQKPKGFVDRARGY